MTDESNGIAATSFTRACHRNSCATIIVIGVRDSYTRFTMELTETRYDLSSALIHLLEAKGVADPGNAVEVLGAPTYGLDVLVVIPAERAKLALGEELMRVTGHRHPNAGDVWFLDEAQSLALVEIGENFS